MYNPNNPFIKSGHDKNDDLRFTVYPNPSSGDATISYTLSESGSVSLSLLGLFGNEIERLIDNKIQEEGVYPIKFDAKDLNNGVYFLALRTQDHFVTYRIIIVR
jgi:hypothetical protein